jgi:hypothetical protein
MDDVFGLNQGTGKYELKRNLDTPDMKFELVPNDSGKVDSLKSCVFIKFSLVELERVVNFLNNEIRWADSALDRALEDEENQDSSYEQHRFNNLILIFDRLCVHNETHELLYGVPPSDEEIEEWGIEHNTRLLREEEEQSEMDDDQEELWNLKYDMYEFFADRDKDSDIPDHDIIMGDFPY